MTEQHRGNPIVWFGRASNLDDVPWIVTRSGAVEGDAFDWCIDWCIGLGDRWRWPYREVGVRQDFVDGTPVVETRLRVGRGDIVHRAWGAHDGDAEGGEIVVEIRNETTAPVALGWVVRPALGRATSAVPAVTSTGFDGDRGFDVDGHRVLALDRRPYGVAVADLTDLARRLDVDPPTTADATNFVSPTRSAAAVGVVPLPHGTSIVARVGLGARSPERGSAAAPLWPEVQRGWTSFARSGPRLEGFDESLIRAVAIARARLFGTPPTDLPNTLQALMQWGRRGDATRWAQLLLSSARRVDGAVIVDGASPMRMTAAVVRAIDDDTEAWRQCVDWLAATAGRRSERTSRGQRSPRAPRSAGDSASGDTSIDIDDALEHARFRLREHGDHGARLVRRVERALVRGSGHDLRRLAPPWSAIEADVRRMNDLAGPTPAAAAFLARVHAALVTTRAISDRETVIELVPSFDRSWLGRNLAVHSLPVMTRSSDAVLSFALRWHGHRPAVLWELASTGREHRPSADFRITAPAIDPAWSTDTERGEALLTPDL